MASLRDTLAEILLPVKEDFVTLGALLEGHGTAPNAGDLVPQLDMTLKRAYHSANAARRILILARRPVYADFDPAAALRELGAFVPHTRKAPELVVQALRMVYGDREQIVEAFRLIGENVDIAHGGRLRTEVTGEPPARIVLQVSGEGLIADSLSVDGVMAYDWETLGGVWTQATHGGHVALDAKVVVLYLEGDRELPEPGLEHAPEIRACKALTRRLMSWRGAIGNYEPGIVDEAEITAIYLDTINRSVADLNEVLEAFAL